MRLFLQVDYRTSNLMQVFAGAISFVWKEKRFIKSGMSKR